MEHQTLEGRPCVLDTCRGAGSTRRSERARTPRLLDHVDSADYSGPVGGQPFARFRSKLVLGTVGLALALGCVDDDARPSFLLITLDTTRADRIGAYGHGEAITPVMDRLASTGVMFEQALAPAPITLPSHASILTGLYPPSHGVHGNATFVLRPEAQLFPEVLRANGMRSLAGVAQNQPPGPESSIDKIFWSEFHQRLTDTAVELMGPQGQLELRSPGARTDVRWIYEYLWSRAGTIYSGSSEIQRNIIAKRVLQMPTK